MTTRLLIARHGNTFAPGFVARRVGVTDLPLVDSGLNQGRLLGAYLLENNLIPDLIFTATLQRAIQTAEQVLRVMQIHLPIQTRAIFNELDYGPDENQPEEVVIARIGKDALNAWETKAVAPEGWKVNPASLIQNWLDFSAELLKNHAGKTCLVVTSNGIARFSPYITGDFNAFCAQHAIKIATGAVCLFENTQPAMFWDCVAWNVRPSEV